MRHRARLLATLVIGFVTVASLGFSADADAKRLGAGKSSGITRSESVVKRDAAPTVPTQSAVPVAPAPQVPSAPQPARSGMWGMLGGLALGVGLGALLSHFGVGAEFGSMLMVILFVVGAVLLFRMFFRRPLPTSLQYAGAGTPTSLTQQRIEPGGTGGGIAPSIPTGFDAEGFLRQAKLSFVRLQAANDAGNLEDIRQFTSPEMYAEILLEYQERGKAAQHTDVVQLDARLLDVSEEPARHIASVRFSGLVREAENETPGPIDEVWHLTKPLDGSGGWVLAGIQQIN